MLEHEEYDEEPGIGGTTIRVPKKNADHMPTDHERIEKLERKLWAAEARLENHKTNRFLFWLVILAGVLAYINAEPGGMLWAC